MEQIIMIAGYLTIPAGYYIGKMIVGRARK